MEYTANEQKVFDNLKELSPEESVKMADMVLRQIPEHYQKQLMLVCTAAGAFYMGVPDTALWDKDGAMTDVGKMLGIIAMSSFEALHLAETEAEADA